MASSSHLKPGETGRVNVKVDVRGKLGRISKTVQVFTNDVLQPVTTLILTMRVKDEVHMEKHDSRALFSTQCRSCHVDQGRGKKGNELFRADCLMCHKGDTYASSIDEMRRQSRQYVGKAIREGISNTSMPAFALENGGPLSNEEIESLITAIMLE